MDITTNGRGHWFNDQLLKAREFELGVVRQVDQSEDTETPHWVQIEDIATWNIQLGCWILD
jgi:hypothetical protein